MKIPSDSPSEIQDHTPDSTLNTEQPSEEVLKSFRLRNIIWPLLIGILVLGYAVYQLQAEGLNPIRDIPWTKRVLQMMGLGFVCMMMRDFGYIWRMRILTDGHLSWKAAFQVTLLWEFASAATPSIVGGSPIAIYLFFKEKISIGKSTAIVFVTIFFDELFYILMLPAVVLFVDNTALFAPLHGQEGSFLGAGLIVGFWIIYGILVSYTIFLAFALFINPEISSRLIRWVFSLRLLKRWQQTGNKTADDLLTAAQEFKTKRFFFWIKAFFATFLAWMGRYLVLNCVLAAFVVMSFGEHLAAYARQAIMFVMMIISPTPGSSGVAEGVFGRLFSEYAAMATQLPADLAEGAGFVLILASLWRLVTYYPYLFLGIPLLSIWLRRVNKQTGT